MPDQLPASDGRLTVTVQEAARLLGIGRQLAYEGVRQGQIPNIRVGRRILVPRAALEKMLEEGTPWRNSSPKASAR